MTSASISMQEQLQQLARQPAPSTSEQAQALFAAYQRLAAAAHIELRATPPEPTTCCGRGCNGCVWEGFYGATHFWIEDAQEALKPGSLADDPGSG